MDIRNLVDIQFKSGILQNTEGQTHYVLHNKDNVRVPYCRHDTFTKSFFSNREHNIIYYYGYRRPSVYHAKMGGVAN